MKRPRSLRSLVCMACTFVAVVCTLYFTPVAHASTTAPMRGVLNFSLTPHIFQQQLAVRTSLAAAALPPCVNYTAPPRCYSPQQIHTSYDIQPLLDQGVTGKGQTIVILDDYQSPTVREDLQLFDKLFHLRDPKLKIIAPDGLKRFDPNDPNAVGFAGEIALDVEWAHAVAPGATIDLVLGNPTDSSIRAQIDALIRATTYAVDHKLGDVLSLSVGAGETCYSQAELGQWHQAFADASDKGISVLVSSGDSGSAVVRCDGAGTPVALVQGVNYPASDPLVTGVGGTTLHADSDGSYNSETVWNESAGGDGGTGGGFSSVFSRPFYQNGVPGTTSMRGVPDVAYDADPLTGVPVVTSSLLPGSTVIIPVGGTSAGAPQWAGIVALINQWQGQRFGFLNESLYSAEKGSSYSREFHDITRGDNAFHTFDNKGKPATIPGYAARKRWDAATGVGSPKVAELVRLLG